jgi:CheY-like chemotaxis protein/nitrogen-specific signal transduction histidine kinase
MQLRTKAIRNFVQALEQRVDERTHELSLAKDEAESANKAKSDFLAVMTHELRTPLNTILGLTKLVETMELGQVQREYVGKVLTSGNLLLGLINNILSYSKMESGEDTAKPEAFFLLDILKKLSDVFESPAHEKGIGFKLELATDLPAAVECDKGKLLQILTNLCGNAIKFTQQGEVKLSVVRVDSNNGDVCRLRFVVIDTGIGIDATEQQGVFKPFSQIDSSVARQYQGTGLGLNICQSFVEMMGGKIGVDSQLGTGSQFWLEVPLRELEPSLIKQKPTAAKAIQEAVAKSKPLLNGLTVILAEDNSFNQTLAIALLSKVGVEVKLAENGLNVISLLEQGAVHGVLMDVQMPRLDGLATTKKLRADSRFAQLPIIAMTANAMDEDKEQVIAAGMNDFVAKPIDFEHLYQVLINNLARDKSYP